MNWIEEKEVIISETIVQYERALLALEGNNVDEAISYFRLAAEPHSAEEKYNWGVIYYNGIGVSKDFIKAFKWVELAAKEHYLSAERLLGWMYYNGEGVDKSDEKAAELFVRAAKNGVNCAATLYMAGRCYLYGISVEKNIDEGMQLLEKAAEMHMDENCRVAQRLLGEIYYEGKYAERDLKAAEKWLLQAIKNRSTDAAELLDKIRVELRDK